MLRELRLKKYLVASLISGSWIGSVEDRCGTAGDAGWQGWRAGKEGGRLRDAILRNRLQKFDKLRSSTLDGVDLYVFGVLHGETIRQTKQRVCLYSLLRDGNGSEGISESVGGWWFVYRAVWMAIYLTGKTDRRYQSLGYKWRCLSRRSSSEFYGARQKGRREGAGRRGRQIFPSPCKRRRVCRVHFQFLVY